MGIVRAHIAHFSVGEYSKAGLARIDYEPSAFAAETQENVFSHVVGKGLIRPPTEYVGNTASNERTRLISFARSVEDVALLALSNGLLRVIVDDTYITREGVSSTVTNGDFSSGTGWSLSASDGSSATISGGRLTLQAYSRGSVAYCEQAVSTTSATRPHALRIYVSRGPVEFRVGSTSGGQEVFASTLLDTGYHSLEFTPDTITYYVRFTSRRRQPVLVESCEVEGAGVMSIPAPWTTSQLRTIMFDQSADVMFMANDNWQQRKVERRGTRSWSVSVYETEDGPFAGAVGTDVQMSPSQSFATCILTADQPIFTEAMEGSLIRLYHDGMYQASWLLAGENQWIDPYIIRGIKETGDRTFIWTIQSHSTATWGLFNGTVTSQRSLTGSDGDFTDWQHTTSGTISETSSGGGTYPGLTEEGNLVAYTRWGFRDGGYTSGVARVTIDYRGYSAYGVGRITNVLSTTQADIDIYEDFTGVDGTRSWALGAWGNYREWPSAVAFFDGRIWWGGADKFWGSASDAYYTFDELEGGDSGSIQRSIATGGQVAKVNWFLPLQRLIIGTTGSEISARSSSFDEPLTPSNITLKDASSIGSAPIKPVKIDSRGVFVHRSLRSIHSVFYSFDANDYTTDDLTETNEDICSTGIVEMSASREPETYIWCVRSDGQVAVLNYDWSERRQVRGWFRFVTDGEVESVAVLPGELQDIVYMVVKRTINGSEVRFIEKLARHDQALGDTNHRAGDAFVYEAGPVESVQAPHLANETGLVGWGFDGDGNATPLTGLSADAAGRVLLGGSYSNVTVGLWYRSRYKSSRLAYGADPRVGTALMQKKRVTQLGLLLADTHRDSISFGPSFDNMVKMNQRRDGVPQGAGAMYDVHDEVPFAFPGEWDTDSRVCIEVEAPYPATMLGLVIGVETNDK